MWEAVPRAMRAAMVIFMHTIREKLGKYVGYEVDLNERGALLAFSSLQEALNWCMETQTALMHAEWPVDLLVQPK